MSTTQKGPNLLDKWFFVQKVVSDRRLSRCAVACAFHLVDYYNDRLGRAWPSYVTLAKLTGSNRRTVIEAVKRLIALKYFEVEKGRPKRKTAKTTGEAKPTSKAKAKKTQRRHSAKRRATSHKGDAHVPRGAISQTSQARTPARLCGSLRRRRGRGVA